MSRIDETDEPLYIAANAPELIQAAKSSEPPYKHFMGRGVAPRINPDKR